MTTYAAILAGGVGNRMHSATIPKQFLTLGDRPIIIWTIQKIIRSQAFDHLYVAIHPEWKDYLRDLIDRWEIDANSMTIVSGGKERLDSIENVVDAIYDAHTVDPDDKILIHDAVRPFITDQIIQDSLRALDRHPAVVAAIPATDTMLWIENGTRVDSMPDRSKLFNGQAPDSFRLSILAKSLKELTPQQRRVITGTAQICLLDGIPIHTIPGDPVNIKLTSDSDMLIAEGLIQKEIGH
ncbi:MAG: 2-C-methyl-D-erythritol 4-phosphate cytidylyltransferase [Clostridiales bacterium]|jgi:2-C-methyl-D-erythritol 4-phosphate cytidylyltransferase|nr:2-C-methyl-D-erythritol 4-phosphate cytidylyltransferase [Clostridiales bacterium]